jgi:hypothetical protein
MPKEIFVVAILDGHYYIVTHVHTFSILPSSLTIMTDADPHLHIEWTTILVHILLQMLSPPKLVVSKDTIGKFLSGE